MTTLLRELLDERSAVPDAAAHHARLTQVHRRITRARRQRVASASAAVAAVAVAVAVVTTGTGVNRTAPPPIASTPTASPTTATIAGIPEYYAGGHVLKAESTELPDDTVALTFTPESLDIMIVTKCSEPVAVILTGPGGGSDNYRCGSSLQFTDWAAWGVTVGQPNTFTLTATETRHFVRHKDNTFTETVDPLPTSGAIALALAQPMSFDDFPLPPRPDVLPPLAGKGKVATIRNAPDDPLAPRTIELPAHGTLNFFAQLQTPGSLKVQLNGKTFITCVKWDYEPTTAQPLGPNSGCTEERVLGDFDPPLTNATFTVIPEHVSGDWQVQVND